MLSRLSTSRDAIASFSPACASPRLTQPGFMNPDFRQETQIPAQPFSRNHIREWPATREVVETARRAVSTAHRLPRKSLLARREFIGRLYGLLKRKHKL